MTEGRLIAILVGVVLVLAAVFFGFRAVYDAGDNAGAARVQIEYDQFKSDQSRLAAQELATVTKQRDDAIANNEVVTNDLQAQLSASQSNADSLIKRVSDYQNRLSASANALRQAASDKDTAIASGIAASQSRLNQAIASYDAACQRDAIRLNKLIDELTPQL